MSYLGAWARPQEGGHQIGPCDACRLIDGDFSPKHVQYCKVCDAYLCDRCRPNPWRRAKAAVLRKLGR